MAAALGFSSAPAPSAAPISQWKIEPSDARCVAVRQYGTSDKPITLALKAPPTGKAMQLAVIRHAFRKNSAQTGATVTIDGQTFQTYALGYPLGFPAKASKQSVYLIHLPPSRSNCSSNASNLSVSVKGGLVEPISASQSEGCLGANGRIFSSGCVQPGMWARMVPRVLQLPRARSFLSPACFRRWTTRCRRSGRALAEQHNPFFS